MLGLFGGLAESGCFQLFLLTGAEREDFILLRRKPRDQ